MLLDDLTNGLGTPSSFDCEMFVLAYDYVMERVADGDAEFAEFEILATDPDSPLLLIYEDHCEGATDETDVFISSTLFANLRTALNALR